ncbi:phospholipid scramblase family member 5-like [Cimex lectularius]|uniref:Phospholipid scramblase n=1 Tax=Cimex lectularius TaxID=79782 RepID=A0A8I6S5K0_CIMLE|nr:phospholipid scramblase family member 5-like [Cimex lectularius]
MSGMNILNPPHLDDDFTFDDGDIPIFDQRSIITTQPREDTSNQIHLPISTVGRSLESSGPFSGLRLLFDVDEVTIEQTYELQDLLTIVQSENRYFIKSNGDILYGGIEESTMLQRLFCSSRRKLKFTLYDRSQEEAIHFTKQLAFTSCSCGCLLQRIKVYISNFNFIGSIHQQWTPFKTTLFIKDSDDNLIFIVLGPAECICPIFKESTFQILDKNCDQVGQIGQAWDASVMNYKLTVTFPRRSNTIHKALLLVCGIILDYMFFESGKSGGCFRCIICHH